MSTDLSRQVRLEGPVKIFENPVKTSQGKMIIGEPENLTMKDEQL